MLNISQLCKTFSVFIVIMHILFCRKNQKNVLQKEIKNWVFEAYSFNKETSSWFHWLDHWKWLVPDLMCMSWIFIKRRVGLFFCSMFLPKCRKMTVTCPESVKKTDWVNIDLPKVSKMNIKLKLVKVSKMTNLKIHISPITKKLEISNLYSR